MNPPRVEARTIKAPRRISIREAGD